MRLHTIVPWGSLLQDDCKWVIDGFACIVLLFVMRAIGTGYPIPSFPP